jgi:hypothetical protein
VPITVWRQVDVLRELTYVFPRVGVRPAELIVVDSNDMTVLAMQFS